jgi:hypothetical protein
MQSGNYNVIGIILTIVGCIAGFVIGYVIVNSLLSSPSGFDKQLANAANEINKICPIMVDSDTRLDNAISMPGKQFLYNYTLVNHKKSDIDITQLQENMRPLLINSIKTNDEMEIFKKNNVTLTYNYKDKEGVFLFKIVIGPEDYTE